MNRLQDSVGKAEYLIGFQSVVLIFLLSIIRNVLQMTQFQKLGLQACKVSGEGQGSKRSCQ